MKRDRRVVWQPTAADERPWADYRAIVVGGTGGIGRALSRVLAALGASVVVVGRTFRDHGVDGIDFVRADLSSMAEAKRIAITLPVETADLIVMTAGIMAGSKRKTTREGIEQDMGISYLSRLVILQEIGPRLGTDRPPGAAKPRVFIMGFPGAGARGTLGDLNAEHSYDAWVVHQNTVAGNEILVLDASERYRQANFYGLNPGLVDTDIRAVALERPTWMMRVLALAAKLFAIAPEVLAERYAPLLVSRDLEAHGGTMFDSHARAVMATRGLRDADYRARFLEESQAVLARSASVR